MNTYIETPISPTASGPQEPFTLTGEVLTTHGLIPLQQWENMRRHKIDKAMNVRRIRNLKGKTIFQLKRLSRYPLIRDVIAKEVDRRLKRKKA